MSDNKILWYITNKGLEMIEEARRDSSKIVTLSRVKFGDGDGEYYVIDPDNIPTTLKNPWYAATVDNKYKDSKDTSGNTIVFESEIPSSASASGVIREVGLYAVTTTGSTETETLFAIATCEPLKKPSSSDNYVITISYSICIKFSDLMSIYDQIQIEDESGYISEGELEDLNKDFLYVESNLMNQISGNTAVIGADMGEQLSETIDSITNSYSNIVTGLNFTSFCNFIDMSNIMGYWVFKYTEGDSPNAYISDLSSGRNFLTSGNSTGNVDDTIYLSAPCNELNSNITGLLPYLDFSGENYFYMGYDNNIKFTDTNGDIPFVISMIIANNTSGTETTYLAKSDYFKTYKNSEGSTLTPHIFEIGKNKSDEIVVKLFTDANNYVKFTGGLHATTTGKFSSVSIKYNGDKTDPKLTIIIDGSEVVVTKSSTGTYNGMPNQILDYTTKTPTEVKLLLTSYLVDPSNIRYNKIDSKIAIINIAKYTTDSPISDNDIKALSLNYMAMSGRNVCYYLV